MDKKQKLSGHAYRKLRLEKQVEAVSNTRPINTFFAQNTGVYQIVVPFE